MLNLDLDEFSGNYVQYPLNPDSIPAINGNITFFELVDGFTKIIVELINTVDGDSYPIHIHSNSFINGGGIVKTLNNINGLTGRSVTFVNSLNDNTVITYNELISFNGHIRSHVSTSNMSALIVVGNIGSNILIPSQTNGTDDIPEMFVGNIKIISVDPVAHHITLKNFDTITLDVSDLRVSSEFRYETISNLTLISGSFSLTPNSVVTFEWALTDEDADLSLYVPTGAFEDVLNMLDFVQWGSAGNGRESVAVNKGIWNQGDYILSGSPYTYIGNGLQTGLSVWQNS